MNSSVVISIRKAFRIAWKDMRIYYFSSPTVMMGLLFPILMFVTFWIGRNLSVSQALPGLAALTAFFSGSSIGVTTFALERTTGTFDTQLSMPVSLFTIALGKTMASFLYGFLMTIIPISLLALVFNCQIASPLLLLISVALSSISSAGLGMVLSVSAHHVHEAMAPLNLIRIPMMFISDIFIPITSFPEPLRTVAYTMPLTHAVISIRYSILGLRDIGMFLMSIGVLILYTIVFLIATAKRLEKSLEW